MSRYQSQFAETPVVVVRISAPSIWLNMLKPTRLKTTIAQMRITPR
jgi:hypothetical protein